MVTSSEALKSYRNAGVLVMIDCVTDQEAIPAPVADRVREDSQTGLALPALYVTNLDATKILANVPCRAMKDNMRGSIRDLRKALEGADLLASASSSPTTEKGERAGAAVADDSPAAAAAEEKKKDGGLLAESQEWTNAAGNKIVAAINRVEDGTVHFVMPDGNYIPDPLGKLSAESRKKIESLSE